MVRKKILFLYPYYWPHYKAGGPVQSLVNLAASFKSEAEFYSVSLDHDIDGSTCIPPLTLNEWTAGPSGEKVFYTRRLSPFHLFKVIRQLKPDTVFINGIFDFQTTLFGLWWAKLLGIGVIISPRGMLQKWGLKRKSVLKKVYLVFLKVFLKRSEHWHATDVQEQSDILNTFGKRQIVHVAPNIPRRIGEVRPLPFPDASGRIRLVFLSLINPNKNLHLLIDAVSSRRLRFSLDIYGPVIDSAYWKECMDRMEGCESIQYKGPVSAWDVPNVLSLYHFFVLPTQGENFGHAIFDALASGVPVIIPRTTPWVGLDEMQAGIYFDVDADDALGSPLQFISRLSAAEFYRFKNNSLAYARDYINKRNFIREYDFLVGE
jgi:glycosyltransferase involved in cell wall biosynthesis